MASRALATAFVNIVPGTKDLELYLQDKLPKESEDAGDKSGKKLGGGMVNAAKAFVGPLIAAFSVFAAVDFFKGAVTAASDLSESQNAIKVTFGDAADAVAKLGEDSAKRLGLSTSQFNGIATQFSAFAGTIAGSGGDISKVVDDISTRGADFASVMNLDVNEALLMFQSGLAGETEPLRKYGIDMSAAAVEAYALSAGIWDGTGQMTESQKVQARYGSLMAQTSKVQGDFANTADGLANSQRIANAEIENGKARLGESLLPIVAAVTTYLTNFFIPILDAVAGAFQWMTENANYSVPILAALGGIILAALAPAIWAGVVAMWAFTVAMLANPFTWIVLGIGVLIGAIVYLAMNWEEVTKWIGEVWAGFMGWLDDSFAAIGKSWEDLWNGVGDFIHTVWTAISDWFTQAITNVVNFVRDYWGLLLSFFIGPLGLVIQWIVNNWDGIVKFFQDTIKNIGKFFSDGFGAIGNGLQTVFGGIGEFFKNTFDGVVSLIKSNINVIISLVNGVIGLINGIRVDIPDFARDLFGGAKSIGFSIPKIPALANGGYVTSPTTALIGEAGPEVVTPLKDFERMMGLDKNSGGKVLNYYAAPNTSFDSEKELFDSMRRSKVVAGW